MLTRARRETITPFALAAVSVGGLGAAGGGYFTSSWGWPIVSASLVAIWAVSYGRVTRFTRGELTFTAGLLAFAGWSALSSLWGEASVSVESAFRVLLYGTAAVAALAVARRGSFTALLAGAAAGGTAVTAYGLATRLFPDRIGAFDSVAGYRLATPLGYWNGLALLCAVVVLALIGLAASSRSTAGAALAAAPIPAVCATLYFTFSRGSWLSLGIGLAVAFVLGSRRIRLAAFALAAGAPAALAVVLASHSRALTHEGAAVARAAHEGHRVAAALFVLTLVAGALAAGAVRAGERVSLGTRGSRIFSRALTLAALAAVAAAVVHYGGPVGTARTAWSSFAAHPSKTAAGPDLTQRLFSLSGDGRVPMWHVAWSDASSHLLAGSGAGTYESVWVAHRAQADQIKNAHSLYLETLAETGIVGLALLLAALAAPVVAGIRARRRRGVAVATGAYVAYLAGAAVDWDWQLPAVTLPAILIGAAILAAARPAEQPLLSPWARRTAIGLAAAVGALGFVFLVGNLFLSRASSAASAGHWQTAAADARRAEGWLPWSTQPLEQLGEAQIGERNLVAAQKTFRAAIRKDSTDWNLWFDLARASTGRTEAAAIAHAKKLNPLSPEIAEFQSELGGGGGISIGVRKK